MWKRNDLLVAHETWKAWLVDLGLKTWVQTPICIEAIISL